MKTIHDELNELRELFINITPEKEEEYKERFLSIQERYTSPEDAEAIGDFIWLNYWKAKQLAIPSIFRYCVMEKP